MQGIIGWDVISPGKISCDVACHDKVHMSKRYVHHRDMLNVAQERESSTGDLVHHDMGLGELLKLVFCLLSISSFE